MVGQGRREYDGRCCGDRDGGFDVVVSKAAAKIDDWVAFEAGGLVTYLKVRLQALVLGTSLL